MSDAALIAALGALAGHRARFEAFTEPATDLIAHAIAAASHDVILDLASGTGHPALTLAMRHPHARILATDLEPALLAELTREARVRELSNLRVLEADMHALPLKAASIGCVVSRFGVQFAREPQRVFAEIARVLRAGGSTFHVVWANPAQPLLRAMLLDLLDAVGERAFAAGTPGPLQFAQPGSLAHALARAGFDGIEEETYVRPWVWRGDARSFWQFARETSAPFMEPRLRALTPVARDHFIESVCGNLARFEHEAELRIPVEVHCACARKPC